DPDEAVVAAAERYRELERASRMLETGAVIVVLLVAFVLALRQIQPQFRARNRLERGIEIMLIGASSIAILTTIGIFVSVLFEALRFFELVSPLEFLFGLTWSPQTAIRADQVGSSGAFGAVPLFAGP